MSGFALLNFNSARDFLESLDEHFIIVSEAQDYKTNQLETLVPREDCREFCTVRRFIVFVDGAWWCLSVPMACDYDERPRKMAIQHCNLGEALIDYEAIVPYAACDASDVTWQLMQAYLFIYRYQEDFKKRMVL